MPRANLLTAAQLGVENVHDLVRDVFQLQVEVRGDEAYFLCPVHPDRKPSASVNLKTGWWSCWSCSAGGDIIHLGTKVLKQSRIIVETSLNPTDADSRRTAIMRSCEALRRREEPESRNEHVVDRVQSPSEFDNTPMDYMHSRGFKNSTLVKFGIKYVRRTYVRTRKGKTMKLRKSIAIPLHDVDGELVSWCFRATPQSNDFQPRYFYTTGGPISEILFAEHLLDENKPVVVTEGAIDAMWIDQAGYQATAVLGASNANPIKADRLSDFRRVVIFGDRNAAGIKFVGRLGLLLAPHTSVSIARYRPSWGGADPNELSVQQVSDAIERAIPIHEWRDVAG